MHALGRENAPAVGGPRAAPRVGGVVGGVTVQQHGGVPEERRAERAVVDRGADALARRARTGAGTARRTSRPPRRRRRSCAPPRRRSIAIGFSHSTCAPRAAAATTTASWVGCGVQTRDDVHAHVEQRVDVADRGRDAVRAAKAPARSVSTSQQATTSTPGALRKAVTWLAAMLPQPTMPHAQCRVSWRSSCPEGRRRNYGIVQHRIVHPSCSCNSSIRRVGSTSSATASTASSTVDGLSADQAIALFR